MPPKLCPNAEVERVSLFEHLDQVLFSLPPDVQVAFVTVDHEP